MTRRSDEHLRSAASTRAVLGAFYDVYNGLGPGLAEAAYERAMIRELRRKGSHVISQRGTEVWYGRERLCGFRPDLLVDRQVVVELKARSRILRSHWAQLLHYMRLEGIEVGLVLNFGPSPEFKRVIYTEKNNCHG